MKYIHLLKCTYGSYLYGTNTDSSDIDTKYIVLPDIDVLLRGERLKNSFVSTGNDTCKNGKNDVDEEYIPLQVFAKDFFKGQTYALELAFAAETHATFYDNRMVDFMKQIVCFLTNNVDSMVGYAYSQAHKYGIKGKRVDAIDKFIFVVNGGVVSGHKYLSSVSGEISKISNEHVYNSSYCVGGYDNVMRPCVKLLEKTFAHDITLSEALLRAENMRSKYGSRSDEARASGGIDWKAISHAVRISGMCVSLLRDKKLSFPLPQEEVALIKKIKLGELEWDTVSDIIDARLNEIDAIKVVSELPTCDQLADSFDRFMCAWFRKMYDIGGAV